MPSIVVSRAGGSSLRAHLVRPEGVAEPWPGVVVVHEVTGLNDDIRRQCDRLGAAGYLTLAPDLYTDGGALRCLRATFRALSDGRGRAVDDIRAARAWLQAQPECTGRVGVIGFCLGGGFALLLANDGFDASAVNYGPLPDPAEDRLAGACPIVASYGGRDRVFGDVPERLETILTEAGVDHDVRSYPGAGHAFMNRHRSGPLGPLLRVAGVGYDGPAAEDAWQRILAFFDRHLGAGSGDR